MHDSYLALCSDAYVNQKLSLKLDRFGASANASDRQLVLEFFDRVRRQFPTLSTFRRRREELSLETGPTFGSRSTLTRDVDDEDPLATFDADPNLQRWIAIRSNHIRSGVVNASSFASAYPLHRYLLELAPYYLSLSPLDLDSIELLYGFDLPASGNHDDIVYEALYADSPIARAVDLPNAVKVDCQPVFGAVLTEGLPGMRSKAVEVNFEVKTRGARTPGGRLARHASGMGGGETTENAPPISIYLWVRQSCAGVDVKELPSMMAALTHVGEELVNTRVIPGLVRPLREAIIGGAG